MPDPTDSTEVITVVVDEPDAGQRLDKLVVRYLQGRVGRARVRSLFEDGAVLVNGRKAPKGRGARAGDTVSVALRGESKDDAAVAEPGAPLELLLVRDDIVVVSKPAGQPTAPLRAGERGTLANALLGAFPELAHVGYGPREPGIIHRLDSDTSGVVVAARTPEAFAELTAGLREARLHKEYLLVCEQDGLADSGEITIPLASHRHDKRRVIACFDPRDVERYHARPASTAFNVKRRTGQWALVLARAPRALRHQIRVHFAAIGHPLAGDGLYEGPCGEIARQALHAHAIRWPGTAVVPPFEVRRAMPEDMLLLVGDAPEAD